MPQSSPLRTQPMTWLRSDSHLPSVPIAVLLKACSTVRLPLLARLSLSCDALHKKLLHETQAQPLVLLQVVQAALAEDAGELGDVTTLST